VPSAGDVSDRLKFWSSFSVIDVNTGQGLILILILILSLVSSLLAPAPAAMGVFCLYIRVKLKPEMVAEFKERFAVLANHVRENEPETVSYQLCESDQSPDEFMIVERYPSRAKLEDPHQQSAPFKTFKEWWVNSGAVIEKSGMSCLETDIGFMARTSS
jgi:quinol monooxygenase YgiN